MYAKSTSPASARSERHQAPGGEFGTEVGRRLHRQTRTATATALGLRRRGAAVALLAPGRARPRTGGRGGPRAGGRALPLVVDVADMAEAVDEAANRVEEEFDPIDVWVNAAFSTVFAPVPEIRPEELRQAPGDRRLRPRHPGRAAA